MQVINIPKHSVSQKNERKAQKVFSEKEDRKDEKGPVVRQIDRTGMFRCGKPSTIANFKIHTRPREAGLRQAIAAALKGPIENVSVE
jgi:hypothetical protein